MHDYKCKYVACFLQVRDRKSSSDETGNTSVTTNNNNNNNNNINNSNSSGQFKSRFLRRSNADSAYGSQSSPNTSPQRYTSPSTPASTSATTPSMTPAKTFSALEDDGTTDGVSCQSPSQSHSYLSKGIDDLFPKNSLYAQVTK